MKHLNFIFFTLLLLHISSCAAKKPFLKKGLSSEDQALNSKIVNIDYELFLVGDIAGESIAAYDSDIVDLIKSQLRPNSNNQSVVFLGNSFSESGLPDAESADFARTDKLIDECIKKLKDNTDKVYFIPGNNEWNDGHQHNTVSALNHVEHYLESKVNDKDIFTPSNGCGEPTVVELTDDLILLLVDSQWVLQGSDAEARQRSGCEITNELELVTFIQDILARNKNKNVIISAHHPVHSNGKTGGNYNAASHLLPLPIVGSIITSFKKLNGGQQKFGHPQYEAYRSAMNLALSNFEGVIHTSAHDKNLQYFEKSDNHFVVAGSGSDVEYVAKGGDAEFAYMSKGFSKITHTTDLELWLEFFVPDPDNPKVAKSIFKKLLYKKEIIDYSDKSIYKDLANYPKSIKTKASETYSKGRIGMGETYRTEWGTEVDIPVLLLDDMKGGLTPVQQGGGFQTKSLRLENSNGNQWVIRSVDKDVTKVVPPALRGTFAQGIVQDGISAAHPYGALAIPKLAKAANIYHANPQMVYVPKQKALGDYNLELADRLYLFEERPGGNMEGHPNYGGATKSINTPSLIEKLLKNHKHEVDQKYVLKARMFDLMIGDWDRHDDQWRWGIYTDDASPGKKVYRAIPRDRDQVFFKNDGFLNYIASRPYISPGLRKYEDDIDFIDGLAFNARHFDRHFISQMTEQDFVDVAQELQNNVNDDAIASAFAEWPEEIYAINGESITNKLKERRGNLIETARDFYKYLSKEVTVIGTNGQNVFDLTTLENDHMSVKAYHMEGGQKNLIWSRDIDGKDCEEVRLFGLKKKDVFNFYGDEKTSIKVRLVGGSGEDVVNNESSTIKILAYDTPDGMTLTGNKVLSKLSDHKGVNSFDRKDWKIDRKIHFPIPSFYTDEGIGISYNVLWQKNGFRKNPYQSNHILSLGFYFANSALVANYTGHWPMAFGPKWDLRVNANAVGPSFTQFFYGLGNENIDYEEIFPETFDAGSTTFYIVRGVHVDLNFKAERRLKNNRIFTINPSIEFYSLDDELNDIDEERFIFTEEAGRTSADFESKIYAGLGVNFTTNRVDNAGIPTRGYIFDVGADFKQSVSDSEFTNLTLNSNIAAYVPFNPSHTIVLATNIGGQYTFGDYEFFHANYLSNQSRLRGFKTNRFAGDGIVYHATDLRFKLLQGNGGFRTGLGIFGAFDYGRAFLEDEGINDWHTSYGGGIYITPLNMIGFKIGYYVGQDDTQLTIGGALSF